MLALSANTRLARSALNAVSKKRCEASAPAAVSGLEALGLGLGGGEVWTVELWGALNTTRLGTPGKRGAGQW